MARKTRAIFIRRMNVRSLRFYLMDEIYIFLLTVGFNMVKLQ